MWKTQRHKQLWKSKRHKQSWKKKKSQIVMKYQEAPFGLPLPTRET